MLSKQWGFISAKDATSVLLFARSARLKVQEDKRSSRVIWYWSDLSDLFSVSCSDHDLSFFLSWVYFYPSIHHSTLVSSGAFKMHIVTSTTKQIYKLKACFFCLFVFVFFAKTARKDCKLLLLSKMRCNNSPYCYKKAHESSNAGVQTNTKLAKPLKTHQVAGHSFRVRGSVRVVVFFSDTLKRI